MSAKELFVKTLVMAIIVLIIGLLVYRYLPEIVPSLVSDDPDKPNKNNVMEWGLLATGALSFLTSRALDNYYCDKL